MTEAAMVSPAAGRGTLADAAEALGLVREPALALDRTGFVLAANSAAEELLGDKIG